MTTFSEAQIIDGVVKHRSGVFVFIYETYYPAIENYVTHNRGSVQQAEDVFQEGLLIAYRKLKSENLYLTCKFSTYLYSVCKNIWNQERRKWIIQQEKLRDQPLTVEDSGTEEEHPIDKQVLQDLLQKHLVKMSPDCQKVLKLTINDCTVEEIRMEMNYNTIHHTIDRKYRCKKSLIKKIISDPLFKRLRDEIR